MSVEFHDVIGFLGAVLILISYFLLQSQKMSSESLTYSVLNLVGALLILFSLANAWNLTAVFIEIVWVGISLLGIVKWYRTHGDKKERMT